MADTIIKKDLLQKETIRLLDKKSVFMPHANTKYEGEIRRVGDTVTVQTFPNVVLGATTPGGVIADQDFTITAENLTAGTSKGLRITVTDIDEAISNLDLHSKVADRIAYALADNFDQLIASHYTDANAANQLDDGDLGTATNGGAGNAATLSTSNVYEAISLMGAKLEDQNVDLMGVNLFVNPSVKALLVQAGFANGSDTGYMDGRRGWVANVAGMDVYVSTNIPASGGSNFIMAFDKDAIHMAQKLTQIDVRQAPDGFFDNIIAETTYGSTVFTENSKRIATFEVTN
jgi:hypothetical protein